MLEMLKRSLVAIAERWEVLIGFLSSTLVAIAIALLLHRFPALRLPTALAATSLILILLLWLFPKWQVRSIANTDLKPEERFDRENEARKTFSQILGGLALLAGFYFTWQNLVDTRKNQSTTEKATQENIRIAQEGQITDRFTKAIARHQARNSPRRHLRTRTHRQRFHERLLAHHRSPHLLCPRACQRKALTQDLVGQENRVA
jgi:hypothetical protein